MKTMRERFDKEFLVIDKTWTGDDFVEMPSDINPNKIKDFIEQELKKAYQEGRYARELHIQEQYIIGLCKKADTLMCHIETDLLSDIPYGIKIEIIELVGYIRSLEPLIQKHLLEK